MKGPFFLLAIAVVPSVFCFSFRSLKSPAQRGDPKITLAPLHKIESPHSFTCRIYGSRSDLVDWLVSQNIKEFADRLDWTDRQTVKASTDIKQGECLLSIPVGLALDTNKAKAMLERYIELDGFKTGATGLIALLLLYEKFQGKSSKYHGYIKSLPEKPGGMMSWSEDEIAEFSLSTTRKVLSQIAAVREDFKYLQSNLQRKPNLVTLLTPEDGELTEEHFYWAVGTVKAGSVLVDGKLLLVPGIDSLSFDPLSTAEPYLASLGGFFGGKAVQVDSERDYDKGEEVVISFGLKSSAECLEDHGIVPDLTDEDSSCEIAVAIDEKDKYYEDKQTVLEDAGYVGSAPMQFDLAGDLEEEIDPLLLQMLRLKFIEGKDSFILEACFAGTVWSQLQLPFSRNNEIRVYQHLADTCESALSTMMPSSTEADSKDVSSHLKAAFAKLRSQERAALAGTLKKARSELEILNGPDMREYYQERRLRELNLLRPLEDSEVILDGDRAPLSDDY